MMQLMDIGDYNKECLVINSLIFINKNYYDFVLFLFKFVV